VSPPHDTPVALLQTLALLSGWSQWRAAHIVWRGLFLFLASATIYASELQLGIELWRAPSNSGLVTTLLFLILGAYAIGLGRAWELLGAPRSGLVSNLAALVGLRSAKARGHKPDGETAGGKKT